MLLEQIADSMMEYYKGDSRRINHFMKVYAYASMIGKLEKLDSKTQEILEMTALMHDIGIKVSEQKYGSSAGRYQELEGPAVARRMLAAFSLDFETVERICYLIGHHHTYTNMDGMDYQILVEADFLVNLDEDCADAQTIARVREKIFRTASGTRILDCLFS